MNFVPAYPSELRSWVVIVRFEQFEVRTCPKLAGDTPLGTGLHPACEGAKPLRVSGAKGLGRDRENVTNARMVAPRLPSVWA